MNIADYLLSLSPADQENIGIGAVMIFAFGGGLILSLLTRKMPKTGNEYVEGDAAEYIYARVRTRFPEADKTTIANILETEWGWQNDHAPKDRRGITLLPRSDPRLRAFLERDPDVVKKHISRDLLEAILTEEDHYEETISK